LLLELKQRDCDIMCLQELSFYKEFWAQSFRGFYMVYQAHPDASTAKGVAIVVR
jgi:mRNA deadenylase 3'-5' endonuclease subunit Ccr4